jgi:hypothetical protein
MSRPTVRILLLIACLTAIGGAAFHLWSSDRRARLDAESARHFHADLLAAVAAAGDLHAAEQAYVAPGQGEVFWFERVDAIRAALEQQLAQLRPLVTAVDAVIALDDADAALRDFTGMDRRVRDYTRQGQIARASDMIFSDGIELTKRASDALARAASSEQVARDAALARIQRTQVEALAGAAGVTVVGLVLLSATGARRVRRRKDALAAPESAAAPASVPEAPRAPLASAARHRPEFGAVATLCNDLARVGDTRALPALLERTATVLDATGVIVWIADPDGRELAPILVHGYPPQLATRLGTIDRDAGNLTASAYRTGLLQTVKADAISSGAVAVPLISAGGCVGVMAAEVKNGGEQQEDLLAAATIVAAQLATLVGPPSTRARSEAAS